MRAVALKEFRDTAERIGFEDSAGQFCWYCLRAVATDRDHFRPRSIGGKEGDNLIPVCKTCNSRKGGGLITEWFPRVMLQKQAMVPLSLWIPMYTMRKAMLLAQDQGITITKLVDLAITHLMKEGCPDVRPGGPKCAFSCRVRPELKEFLQLYSGQIGVPMTTLLTAALEDQWRRTNF